MARAVILSAIGGHSHAQTVQRTKEKHLDAHGRGERRHTSRTQRVVGTLQHDAANGGDRELKSHGNTDAQHRQCQPFVHPPLGDRALQHLEAAHHVAIAQQGRQSLRKHRGNGGSGHSPTHHEDAEEVEHNVQHRGKQQKPEWRFAVAQRTDDAGEHIVEERARHADERNEQIQIGIVEDVFRRAHAAQNERTEQRRDHSDDHRHHCRQTQTGPHVATHRDIIVRTELLRYGDAETSATPRAETQYQKDDRAAGSHRSQSIDTQKFAHDGRIDQRISLLKQIAQQQG